MVNFNHQELEQANSDANVDSPFIRARAERPDRIRNRPRSYSVAADPPYSLPDALSGGAGQATPNTYLHTTPFILFSESCKGPRFAGGFCVALFVPKC